jgi:hypothetical protein
MSEVDLTDILGEEPTPKKRGRGRPRKEQPISLQEFEEAADLAPPAEVSLADSKPVIPEYPLAPTQNGLRPGDAGYNYELASKELSVEAKSLADRAKDIQDTARVMGAMGHRLQVKKTDSEITQEYLANSRARRLKENEEAENAKKVLAELGLKNIKLA